MQAHNSSQYSTPDLSSPSTTMPPLWNPTEVLNLPIHHNCVFPRTTRKGHGHCGMTLPAKQVIHFNTTVEHMAQLSPGSGAVYALLIELAECGLCKHLHSQQQRKVIADWVRMIEEYWERLPLLLPLPPSPQHPPPAAELAEVEAACVDGFGVDRLGEDGQLESAATGR